MMKRSWRKEEEHNNNNQNTGYGGKEGDSPKNFQVLTMNALCTPEESAPKSTSSSLLCAADEMNERRGADWASGKVGAGGEEERKDACFAFGPDTRAS